MKQRNNNVDVIRGFAMLLVVLGHTISGTVSEYSDSLLFQAIWTLQMPLFIIISGYVTRYSCYLTDGKSLCNYFKKRTLAYLLPWCVWTFIIRGLIFGQYQFFDLKYLLWHMDCGYWFLITIWTISMIFGLSDLLSNKWFKDKLINVIAHIAFCLIGFFTLVAIGYFVGFEFFAIKLTIYYLPIYLIGYLFGQYQDWMLSKSNATSLINYLIVISFALWLAAINRFDFFTDNDNFVMVAGRFIASMLGCCAIIGLFSAALNSGGGGGDTNCSDGQEYIRWKSISLITSF